MSPSLGRRMPTMALSTVLFPAPLGPTTVTTSPRRVDAGQRRVEQQDRGLSHQPAHDLQQPLLAPAEPAGVLVLPVRHPEAVEQDAGALDGLGLLAAPPPPAEQGAGERRPALVG